MQTTFQNKKAQAFTEHYFGHSESMINIFRVSELVKNGLIGQFTEGPKKKKNFSACNEYYNEKELLKYCAELL